MSNGAAGERRLDRLVHHVVDVRRPHDALIVGSHVHEQLVEIDVLLIMRSDEIVERVSRDRQHRLSIALRVIEPVQQMYAARPGSGQAHAKTTRVLGIATRGKCGGLFVANLYEPDPALACSQRFEDAVDPVARESKDRVDPPIDESFDQ
ncbi:MAG TPA: hypothetical protein VLD17_02370 [Gemmatimonadaceae bacterium]|nr:hypothetical protein [Gemmatimonadaceae bacterium]